MIGWRFWQVIGGKLVSPFAGEVLPDSGVLTSVDCTPIQIGVRGVSYWPSCADAAKAVAILDDGDVAITAGVIGPSMPDSKLPLYSIVGGIGFDNYVGLPVGRRTDRYRVEAIYSDVPVVGYAAPVQPMAALT